jgi:hypothetical protein
LILVQQEDDAYSRAVCKSIQKNRATVLLVDYGTILMDFSTTKIMKLPLALLFTCCATDAKVSKRLQQFIASKSNKELEKIKTAIQMENVTADQIEKIKDSLFGYQYIVDISSEKLEALV